MALDSSGDPPADWPRYRRRDRLPGWTGQALAELNAVERSADHEGELHIQERLGVREPAEAVIVRQATEVAMPPGLESSLLQFLRSC